MTTASKLRSSRRTARLRRAGAGLVGAALVATCLVPATPALAAPSGSASPAGSPASGWTSAGTLWGDAQLDRISQDPQVKQYEPRRDPGSLYSITTAIGAREVWAERDAQGAAITGKGVTVAVLDSGVAPVPGLADKLVQGPDLSLESNSDQQLSSDTYGHGTHMASIIGAGDPTRTLSSGTPVALDGKAQLGVAPGAQLLALKLGNTDGSTDVSQVIAGIDWVVEHRNDNGMNVRVINLSYGTESSQGYQQDPLAAAVERAWQRGIVVVASAGNGGKGSRGLDDPAYDPYVLAVGSTSPNTSDLARLLSTTPAAWQTWLRPSSSDYSSRGTWQRPVDVSAPGRSVTGLRAPGSAVDLQHAEGRVAGDGSGRLFRGSGTSQSAAVVSGVAALMLQADPTLTPDEVKATITSTARTMPGVDVRDAGSGQVDAEKAVELVRRAALGLPSAQALVTRPQSWARSTGLGSLEATRGGSHLVDPETGQPLVGELDVQGRRWDGRARSDAASRDATWSGGTYMGVRWSGDGWSGVRWSGVRWSGVRWSGVRWSATHWDGVRWSGVRWSSSRYDGVRWS